MLIYNKYLMIIAVLLKYCKENIVVLVSYILLLIITHTMRVFKYAIIIITANDMGLGSYQLVMPSLLLQVLVIYNKQ